MSRNMLISTQVEKSSPEKTEFFKHNGRPLKIAMVVASPFPANHGTPGSIREMARAIADKSHRVHVVTYHFGEDMDVPGIQIHRIPDLGFRRSVVVGPTLEKPLLDLLMVFKLLRVIRLEGIDLIHAHNYEGALVGSLARILTGRPLIYNAVNTMSDELPTYGFIRPKILAAWLGKFLDCWVPRMADQIIAISDDLALFLQAHGIRSERIHVIPLGVEGRSFDGQDRSIARTRYNLNQNPLVIYTGTLDRFQRVDYLIRAMKIVTDKIHNARLLIVANLVKAGDLENCHRIIQELGLEGRVEIAKNGSFEEIPLFLAAADVAVVCRPNTPGFPVKLLNYMASGRPIVVFKGSAKGLQHLQSAFVVEDHDWQGLAQGIITLLQNPVLAQMLGHNALRRVTEDLCWPVLVEKIEKVYYSVLAK